VTIHFRTIDDIADARGKRALVRVDLNVPLRDGTVTDDTRIRAALPTIRDLLDKGAKVVLLSHFGRPKGRRVPEESLEPVVPAVAAAIGKPVQFAPDCVGPEAEEAVANMVPGDVLVLENTRFHAGEEKNEDALADGLARLGDLYVNDAFSAAHRAHASTEGIARRLPSYAGRSMQTELEALESALENPRRPAVAIVGGAKVSSKIDVLQNLVAKVDGLVIAGAMANTFLAALGVDTGRSLVERDHFETARAIMAAAERAGCALVLPKDAVAAEALAPNAPHVTVGLDEGVPANLMVVDLGPGSIGIVEAEVDQAVTVLWNGPLGAFEYPPFDRGTVHLARHVAERTREQRVVSIAGGGDTAAALHHAGVASAFSHVSTAGGAFLEWLEGRTLPGVAALAPAETV
jgi:phosphoglycerate kinase